MMFGRYPHRFRKIAFMELSPMSIVYDPDVAPAMSHCLEVEIDYADNTIKINGYRYDLECAVIALLDFISTAWQLHNPQHIKAALAKAVSRLKELGYIEELKGWKTSNTILYQNSEKSTKE